MTEGIAIGLDPGTSVWSECASPSAVTLLIDEVELHLDRDGDGNVETEAQVALCRE